MSRDGWIIRRVWRAGISLASWLACYACSRIEPHRQPGLRHVGLRLAHAVLAEMKDGCRQDGGRMAVADALDQMIEGADAARRDHRHRHRVGDRAGERD